MPLIDKDGRVLGRVNVIDATIVGVVLVLMPIVYTATRLFLVPKPVIERVEPATQVAGSGLHIRVIGRHLRPNMRAVVTPSGYPSLVDPATWADQPYTMVMVSPSLLDIEIAPLKPGEYDLRFFSSTEELARLTHAFTLTAPPPPVKSERVSMMHAKVRFELLPQIAAAVRRGDKDIPDAPAASADQAAASSATIKNVRVVLESLPPTVSFGAGWGGKLVEADVDIPVRQNAKGEWQYGQAIIRLGEQLNFQTERYWIRGLIGAVELTAP